MSSPVRRDLGPTRAVGAPELDGRRQPELRAVLRAHLPRSSTLGAAHLESLGGYAVGLALAAPMGHLLPCPAPRACPQTLEAMLTALVGLPHAAQRRALQQLVDSLVARHAYLPRGTLRAAHLELLKSCAAGRDLAALVGHLMARNFGPAGSRQAREVLGQVVGWMFQDAPQTALALLAADLQVVVLSRSRRMTQLPEWDASWVGAGSEQPGRLYANSRATYLDSKKMAVVGKESLSGGRAKVSGAEGSHAVGFALVHEIGHAVDFLLMTGAQRQAVREAHASTRAARLLVSHYAGLNAREYWAVLTQAYLGVLYGHPEEQAWVRRTQPAAVVALLEHFYGSPTQAPDWGPAQSARAYALNWSRSTAAFRGGAKPFAATPLRSQGHSVVARRTPRFPCEATSQAWQVQLRRASEDAEAGYKPFAVASCTLGAQPMLLYRRPDTVAGPQATARWGLSYHRRSEAPPGAGWQPFAAAFYLGEDPVTVYRRPEFEPAAAAVAWDVTYLGLSTAAGPGWKPIGVVHYRMGDEDVVLYRRPRSGAGPQDTWQLERHRADAALPAGYKPFAVSLALGETDGQPMFLSRRRGGR